MTINPRANAYASLAFLLGSAVALSQCSGSTTSPSSNLVSGVTLSASSVAVGGSVQGTASLTTVASGAGATVVLSSSNAAVASVPASVAIPAGASSATFTVTGVTAGTATITAAFDGGSRTSSALTVTGQAALSSIVLSASQVVGGNAVTGTANLTAPAPSGGAVVTLSAANPVSVPASVSVAAGLTSATFSVSTRAVGAATNGTITGSYGGATASAALSVTPVTVADSTFGVSGPSETETCTMANNGTTLNCTFDGSRSVAPGTIVAWEWTYTLATTFTQTTTGAVLSQPAVNCAFLPAPPLPAGSPWFTMSVTLRIRDNLGNTAVATNSGVRLLPQGACGF